MRARDVVGRTIVAVRQVRCRVLGGYTTLVDALVLDNGTELRTHAYEVEDEGPAGTIIAVLPARGQAKTHQHGEGGAS